MLALAGLFLGLSACGKPDLPGHPLVQVNGKLITDYQLNSELQETMQNKVVTGRAGVLQALIDRQLLQEEALRIHLDRDPNVKATIENAKAQILAQAYLHSRLAYTPAPSRDEIHAYFNRHPDKFSKRKLFHLKEIALSSSLLTGELKAVMDQARSLDDIAAWLDGRRMVYALGRQVRSSADLPEAVLARMRDLQVGQMVIFREGDTASVLAIASVQEDSLTFEAAAPQIERILHDEKSRRQGETELTRLRAGAKLAYFDKNTLPPVRMQNNAQTLAPALVVGESGVQPDMTH